MSRSYACNGRLLTRVVNYASSLAQLVLSPRLSDICCYTAESARLRVKIKHYLNCVIRVSLDSLA